MFVLTNAVILLPVRIDQPLRLQNLQRNIQFLKTHLDVEILVIEQDAETKIPNDIPNLFVRDGDTFHKTRLFNLGVQQTNKSVCFFLDVDVLVDPKAYEMAYTKLMNNQADVCLLYKRNAREYVEVDPELLKDSPCETWMDKLRELRGIPAKCEGGIVAFRRSSYLDIGGFNEYFIGYGSEDSEILLRSRRCGLRYEELPFSIYHQTHDVKYRLDAISTAHQGYFVMRNSEIHSVDALRQQMTLTSPRYVTKIFKGGRLGNVIFELAFLFDYAKQTRRIPFMHVPSEYKEFLEPLTSQMGSLPKGPRQRLESHNDNSVFYNEIPLNISDTPIVEVDVGYAQCPLLHRNSIWLMRDLFSSKKEARHPTDVLIHIRRGDYTQFVSTYEQLGELYYRRAMTKMREWIPGCRFIVFTDNPSSVKQESYLQTDDVQFFDDSSMKPWEILQEMSRFQNFIVANSTFSWWGAKLSKHANKVIAPLHWTNTDSPRCLGFWSMIYEPEWVRISNRNITILSTDPQFDLFRPAEGQVADISIVRNIPATRLPARIVALLTDNPHAVLQSPRPAHVDCVFSTKVTSVGLPHPSWRGHPAIYVSSPEHPTHFSFIQSVTETLRSTPSLSVMMLVMKKTRPGSVFQSIDSLFKQSYRSWEILYVTPSDENSFVGILTLPRMAIPKILCILPIQERQTLSSVFYARTPNVAVVFAGCIFMKNKLEDQTREIQKYPVQATYYVTPQGKSHVPIYRTAFTMNRIRQDSNLYSTLMFQRTCITTPDYWLPGEMSVKMNTQATTRFVSDVFDPGNEPEQPNFQTPEPISSILNPGLPTSLVPPVTSPKTTFETYFQQRKAASAVQNIQRQIQQYRGSSGLRFAI